MSDISISLDGLGMDEKSMLELVNRLNANDDRKWVLVHRNTCGQMANIFLNKEYNGMANRAMNYDH